MFWLIDYVQFWGTQQLARTNTTFDYLQQ